MKKLTTALLTTMFLIAGSTYAENTMSDAAKAYAKGNYGEVVRISKQFALSGDAKAQTILGTMYDTGEGVVKNYAEAAKWYKLAAAQGHKKAQSSLGNIYFSGKGVKKDYSDSSQVVQVSRSSRGC